MGLFSRIKEKIWGSAPETAKTVEPEKPVVASSTGAPSAAPTTTAQTTTAQTGAPASPAPSAAPAAPAQPVDVAAILDKAVADKGQKLNWKTSIVDLMKALDIDSSLAARKELAQELGYKGALDGSAEMNIWLHKQVIRKLAENGGKVPADLLD
jgi:hypothetical protein